MLCDLRSSASWCLTALQDSARPPRHVEWLCVLEGEFVINETRATEASGSEDEQ